MRVSFIRIRFKFTLLHLNEINESRIEGLVPVRAGKEADSTSIVNELQEIFVIYNSLIGHDVVHWGKGERVYLLHDCVRLFLSTRFLALSAKLVIGVLRITALDLSFILCNA